MTSLDPYQDEANKKASRKAKTRRASVLQGGQCLNYFDYAHTLDFIIEIPTFIWTLHSSKTFLELEYDRWFQDFAMRF